MTIDSVFYLGSDLSLALRKYTRGVTITPLEKTRLANTLEKINARFPWNHKPKIKVAPQDLYDIKTLIETLRDEVRAEAQS